MRQIAEPASSFATTAVPSATADEAGSLSPDAVTPSASTRSATHPPARDVDSSEDDSLFERFPWIYVFFRERCFRDDTARIIKALWGNQQPQPGTKVMELGCGPGFYSCQLAKRFPQILVTGLDRSARQLGWAEKKARSLDLRNCTFDTDNVHDLTHDENTFDVVLAARLFTVLPNPQNALTEMHRILRPGGRCLIAEPRYAFWAGLPLLAMWALAGITGMNNGCREPGQATVLSAEDFEGLFVGQPWRQLKVWQDGRYQYALCEKR